MTSDNGRIDFAAVARRADEMRERLARTQGGLSAMQSVGYGGGGLVKATVLGDGRLADLQIDPSLIDPDDPRTLSETVIAAVDEAQRGLAEQRAAQLGEVTEGFNGLIEGLRASSGGGVVPLRPDRRPGPRDPQGGAGR